MPMCSSLCFLLLLFSFPHLRASPNDSQPVASVPPSTALNMLPPDPTDPYTGPVSNGYFNPKTYSIKEFHELVQGLNTDIRDMFKQAEKENSRFSSAVSGLSERVGQLEEALRAGRTGPAAAGAFPAVSAEQLLSPPCLLLGVLVLLLLAIALLVLCNTLTIRRMAVGGRGADGRCKEKEGQQKSGNSTEMVQLVKEAV